MEIHHIKLTGPALTGKKIDAAVLKELLEILIDGSRQAVRLRLEGRSTLMGQPIWLLKCSAFDFVSLKEGSTEIVIEAKPLREAAPDKFGQPELFGSEVDSERSALAHFEDSLSDIFHTRTDSDLFDQGIVKTAERFGGLLKDRVDSIEFRNGRAQSIIVTPDSISKIKELRCNTPPSRHVRVTGKLDVIRHSDMMFNLILDTGEKIRGVADGIAPDRLAGLFGCSVLVSGRAVFRPSGRVLGIEASHIETHSGEHTLWSKMPAPLFGGKDGFSQRKIQGPRSGFNAIFGKWPGEESDEEIKDALENLS